LVSLNIVSNVSRFKPELNLNRVLGFGGFKPRLKLFKFGLWLLDLQSFPRKKEKNYK